MVFGDSISSGYGLSPGSGWVSLLSKRLQERGPSHPVVNASISGDTTSSGLARIEQSLKTHRPEIVIIELGGNDGLRGSSIDSISRNLEALIESCHRSQAKVLLVGMHLPPNYGANYTKNSKRSSFISRKSIRSRSFHSFFRVLAISVNSFWRMGYTRILKPRRRFLRMYGPLFG